jgi:hypothetical protein
VPKVYHPAKIGKYLKARIVCNTKCIYEKGITVTSLPNIQESRNDTYVWNVKFLEGLGVKYSNNVYSNFPMA